MSFPDRTPESSSEDEPLEVSLKDEFKENEESVDEHQFNILSACDEEPNNKQKRNPCPLKDFVEALKADDASVAMSMLPGVASEISTQSYYFKYNGMWDTMLYGGATPLLLAVQHDREDVVQVLIQRGSRADAKDKNGTTTLHLAALYGKPNQIKFLASYGCDLNAISDDFLTPLHFAVVGESIEAVKTLVALGADIRVTYKTEKDDLLQMAVADINGKSEIVKYLIEMGYPLRVDGFERNLLHCALDGWGEYTDATVLKLLLEAGVDPLQECDDRRTPLWCTARCSSCLPLKTFIDFGVPLNSSKSKPPLVGAVSGHSNLQAVLLLLAHGCDTEQSVWGRTAYQTASNDDVRKALEDNGCVVD